MGCVSYTRRRISHNGFADNLFFTHLRQLRHYYIPILVIRKDEYIFGWKEVREALVCLLYKCLSSAQYIQKLFRIGGTADRPEPAAYSSCKNYCIVIVHFSLYYAIYNKALIYSKRVSVSDMLFRRARNVNLEVLKGKKFR